MPSQKGGVAKQDLKGFKEEIVHQFHVISEGVIDQVKLCLLYTSPSPRDS